MPRTPLYSSEKEFVAKIQAQDFARALMDVTTFSAGALKASRELISMLGLLSDEQLRALMDWVETDLTHEQKQALLQIPDDLLYIPEAVARHEVGHAIVGRALGFQLGALHIGVSSASGDHSGSAGATANRPLNGEAEIMRFLDDRVVVLMAGTMAEAERPELVGRGFDNAFRGSWSDHSKAMDFIQLLANMKGVSFSQCHDEDYPRLRGRTFDIVREQYRLIECITSQLMERIKVFGTTYGWHADEFAQIVAIAEAQIS